MTPWTPLWARMPSRRRDDAPSKPYSRRYRYASFTWSRWCHFSSGQRRASNSAMKCWSSVMSPSCPQPQDGGHLFLQRQLAGNPGDAGEPPEPFHLPPGELAGGDLDLLDGVVERRLAAEVVDEFVVSGRLAGGLREGAVAVEQPAGLVQPAGVHHRLHAGVDPAIEYLAVPVQADPHRRVPLLRRRPLALKRRDRLARQPVHLQRADEPLGVVAVQSGGGRGID